MEIPILYRHYFLNTDIILISPNKENKADLSFQKPQVETRIYLGLPRWLTWKEHTYKCRRRKFDPWVGKIPCKRKWQPTLVFLPGKFHGQRSLVGYHS